MKARRKGTKEPFQKVASVNLCSGGYILVKDVEFEQEPNQLNPEEEKLRHLETIRQQAAIAAMQGIMGFFGSIDYNNETIAKLAVEQADALIKELKGG